MDRRQSGQDIAGDTDRLVLREPAPFLHQAGEIGALDQLHPEPGAIIVGLHAVDARDVGMLHPRQEPRFFLQGPKPSALSLALRGEKLQGDLSLEGGIPGAIHLAESAPADQGQGGERAPLGEGSFADRVRGHANQAGRGQRVRGLRGQTREAPDFGDNVQVANPALLLIGSRRRFHAVPIDRFTP